MVVTEILGWRYAIVIEEGTGGFFQRSYFLIIFFSKGEGIDILVALHPFFLAGRG